MNKKKRLFITLLFLVLSTGLFAQAGRYRLAKEIYDNPSILTEGWFWIVVIICLALVGIYKLVKDKDE